MERLSRFLQSPVIHLSTKCRSGKQRGAKMLQYASHFNFHMLNCESFETLKAQYQDIFLSLVIKESRNTMKANQIEPRGAEASEREIGLEHR